MTLQPLPSQPGIRAEPKYSELPFSIYVAAGHNCSLHTCPFQSRDSLLSGYSRVEEGTGV